MPASTVIDGIHWSRCFQLLSERVDAIGHSGETRRKDGKERRDSGKQEDGRERDLEDVRNAVDAVQAESCRIFATVVLRHVAIL
jgi:hypothetical protein